LNLAAGETYSGALDWFDVPLFDLNDWAKALSEVQEERKKATKKQKR
jgi:hypothetical protein